MPWRVTDIVSKCPRTGCGSFPAGCAHLFRGFGDIVSWVPVQICDVPEVSWNKNDCAVEFAHAAIAASQPFSSYILEQNLPDSAISSLKNIHDRSSFTADMLNSFRKKNIRQKSSPGSRGESLTDGAK